MIYLVTALKPEAQAFVDFYKLKKEKLSNYTVFKNDKMILIISGLGVDHSRNATQTLINHFDITDSDIYINVGICGANDNYAIGELLEIGSICYDSFEYIFKTHAKKINCLEEEAKENIYDVVDMESFGFYDAVIHSPAIKNFYIFKIVSDHFSPQNVTREGTKTLVFNAINKINTIIHN